MMRNLVPLSLILVQLAACSSGSDNGGSVAGPDGNPAGSLPPANAADAPDTLVEGTWESVCLPASGNASGRRLVVAITDGTPDRQFRFIDTTYGDAACQEGDALREAETRGSFADQPFETGQDPADGVPIDLSIRTVLLRPRIRQVADTYNASAVCGLTNWTSNVDQDIAGCEDMGGVIGISTESPRTDFNLFLVEDNATPDLRADDRLLLGTLNAQTDPAARPSRVSREIEFTRRPGTAARPEGLPREL